MALPFLRLSGALQPIQPAAGGLPPPISFEDLYRQHFSFVLRSLRRLGVPPGDAPDLAQEVFMVAFRRLADFEGRSRIETWIFGICLRVASDHRRSAVVRREVTVARVDLWAEAYQRPQWQAEQQDRRLAARRILDGMPESQKLVLMLFELEGWSGEDIAAALALPVGTVRSRLRLARSWLSKEERKDRGHNATAPVLAAWRQADIACAAEAPVVDPIAATTSGIGVARWFWRATGVKVALVIVALAPLGYEALLYLKGPEEDKQKPAVVGLTAGRASPVVAAVLSGPRVADEMKPGPPREFRPSAQTGLVKNTAGLVVGASLFIEAEAGELQGFTRVSDASASGGTHVMAPPGRDNMNPNEGPRAVYQFAVERPARFALWVRLRAPRVQADSFFVRLDGGPWLETQLTTGDLFHWVALHDFDLASRRREPMIAVLQAGSHRLEINNREGGTMIDRFYVTAIGDTPAGNDDRCRPPHSVLRAGVCVPSCGRGKGEICSAIKCAGLTLIDAYDCANCCKP